MAPRDSCLQRGGNRILPRVGFSFEVGCCKLPPTLEVASLESNAPPVLPCQVMNVRNARLQGCDSPLREVLPLCIWVHPQHRNYNYRSLSVWRRQCSSQMPQLSVPSHAAWLSQTPPCNH
eukprot:5009244-Amphidinium_carterae.1